MLPGFVIQLLEIIIPPLISAVVSYYERKEQTEVNAAKLQTHQAALDALQPKKV